MKRAIFLLALAALPLAGCGGKAKEPDAKAAAADKAKPKDDKKALAKEDHVNPWAKDAAPGSQPSDAAAAKPADKAKPAAETHVNPWAKAPPPGSEPSEAAADKAKAAKAK